MTTLPSRLSVSGRFDGSNDVDCFSLQLMAGQRYRFQAFAQGSSSSGLVSFSLSDSNGIPLHSALGSLAGGSAGIVFVPETSGTYSLRLALEGDLVGSLPYRLEVAAVAADDHPDSRAFAEPMQIGSRVQGTFDQAGEVDSFALDLVKGQWLQFQVFGMASASGAKLRIEPRLFGPDGLLLNNALSLPSNFTDPWHQKFLVPETGQYVLSLRSGAGMLSGKPAGLGSYELGVLGATPDDHSDQRAHATLVQVGKSVAVELNAGGDVDWLKLELAKGQTVDMQLRQAGVLFGRASLSVMDAQGARLTDGGSELLFKAPASETYWVRINSFGPSASSAGIVEFLARQVTLIDEGSSTSDAVRLVAGTIQTGTHLHSGDKDWFVFEAMAGQRYGLTFGSQGGGSEPMLVDASGRAFDHSVSFGLGQPAPFNGPFRTAFFETSQSGPVYLSMKSYSSGLPTNSVRYQFTLDLAGRDDHGDTQASATALHAGTPLGVTLDQGDRDVFRVELVQGQRYRFDVKPEPGNGSSDCKLTLAIDELGNSISSWSVPGNLLFTPSQSGTYYLRAEGQGVGQSKYVLTLSAQPKDDHGDLASLASLLGILAPSNFSGIHLSGQSGADTLSGSPAGDWLLGGGGNDRLAGLGGNDVIDGGDGLDTAVFAGRLGDYSVRGSQGHFLIEQRSSHEEARLDRVERLQFEGGGVQLALDLDSHAGQVARIIGALFGKATLSDSALVGLGLQALDGGMDYAELIAVAVGSDLFAARAGSHSHSDFVRTVYANLFGQTPGAAELAQYVGLLERGEFTQATLAQLACDLALNAAQIDLVGLADTGLPYLPAG